MMEHAGVGHDASIGAPPPRGAALNENDFQGPPMEGGLARSVPLVGPAASAVNNVAAPSSGMVKAMSLPSGVSFPKTETPTTVAMYLRPWAGQGYSGREGWVDMQLHARSSPLVLTRPRTFGQT